MSDELNALIREAHEIHVTTHGPRCGIVLGRNSNSPCITIWRAFRSVFPREADNYKEKTYYAANPEKPREKARRFHAKNPQKHYKQVRRWRATNPDKVREFNRRAYEKRKDRSRAQTTET